MLRIRRRLAVIAAAFIVPLAGIGAAVAVAGPASASTSYTIVGLAAESVQGTSNSCTGGGDARCVTAFTTGTPQTYTLINEGDNNCNGGTCWHIQDNFSKLCLDWASPEEPGSGFVIELTCTGGDGNTDEDFSNAPTNGTFGVIISKGATTTESNGKAWGIVWDSSNKFLEVVSSPGVNYPTDGKWTMNG
jgi:hypothetical protein